VLPDATTLGAVHLRVADLDRSLGFYHTLAGLPILERDATTAVLGFAAAPLIRLRAIPGLLPALPHAAGLFHTAILYPDRHILGAAVRHISATGYPFSGASDHLVSEAFYLDDPDGNGVELYRDRPRRDWRWARGAVEMASLPLDIDGVLDDAAATFESAPESTRIGHVHLQVSDLPTAEAFYTHVVGFSLTTRFGEAASFIAAGGYHHHMGLNVWRARGQAATPRTHAGLDAFEIVVPTDADVAAVRARAIAAGAPVHRHDDGLVLTDPWEHEVIVRTR
jgi:catechol 2,3-dioxygenase